MGIKLKATKTYKDPHGITHDDTSGVYGKLYFEKINKIFIILVMSIYANKNNADAGGMSYEPYTFRLIKDVDPDFVTYFEDNNPPVGIKPIEWMLKQGYEYFHSITGETFGNLKPEDWEAD